jgi:hypothetical protein
MVGKGRQDKGIDNGLRLWVMERAMRYGYGCYMMKRDSIGGIVLLCNGEV